MMNVSHLVARADGNGLDTTHIALLSTLLIILIVGLVLIGALFFLRSARRARKNEQNLHLPLYEKRQSSLRRLTITAMPYKGRESVVVFSEKQDLMSNSSSPPASPVPEIRITFPDEVDEAGKRQSGRVVVVRVGDHSVGLEPVTDHLPPYQRDAADRFDSLDLDRIGGLKEKDNKEYS